jgi:cell division protein FtsQ
VKDRLYKIQRIEKARVLRIYPHTLRIKVTERKGFLYLLSLEGDLFPVDARGMVMEYAFTPSKEDLPIVQTRLSSKQLHAGKIVSDSLLKRVFALQKQILAEQPDFVKSISEYYLDNGMVIIVDARNGTRILLGNRDLKDQLRRYQFVQDNGNIDRSNILDLRYKDQVVVRREVQ